MLPEHMLSFLMHDHGPEDEKCISSTYACMCRLYCRHNGPYEW